MKGYTMGKFSTYFSPDTQSYEYTGTITKDNLIKFFDDQLYIRNFGSISVNPDDIIYVINDENDPMKQFQLTDGVNDFTDKFNDLSIDDKVKIMNLWAGNNYYSISNLRTWKRGYFIAESKIQNGYYPIQPKLVGSRFYVVNNLGNKVIGNSVSFQKGYPGDGMGFETKVNGSRDNVTLSAISSNVSIFHQDMLLGDLRGIVRKDNVTATSVKDDIKTINSLLSNLTDIGQFGTKAKLFGSIVYDVTTNKPLLAISMEPIYFVSTQIDNFPWKSELIFAINKDYPDFQFYLVSTSSILVFSTDTYNFDLSDFTIGGANRENIGGSNPKQFSTVGNQQMSYTYSPIREVVLGSNNGAVSGYNLRTKALGIVGGYGSGANSGRHSILIDNYYCIDNVFLPEFRAGKDLNASLKPTPIRNELYDIVDWFQVDWDMPSDNFKFSYHDRNSSELVTSMVYSSEGGNMGTIAFVRQWGVQAEFLKYSCYNWDSKTGKFDLLNKDSTQIVYYPAIYRADPTALNATKFIIPFFKDVNITITKNQPRIAEDGLVASAGTTILSAPFDVIGEDVNMYQFDIQVDSNDAPYLAKLPVSMAPWYEVNIDNQDSDILISSDVDELLSQNFPNQDLLDVIASNLVKQTEANSHLVRMNKMRVDDNMGQTSIDTIVSELIKDGLTSVDGIIDQEKDYLINHTSDKIQEIKDKFPQVNLSENVNRFRNFTIIITTSVTDSVTSLLGVIRIAQTNVAQLPQSIVNKLNDYSFTEDEIIAYANQLENVVISTIGSTIKELMDTVDITNELNLINASLGEQVSSIANYVNNIATKLSSMINEGIDKNSSSIKDLLENFTSSIDSVVESLSQSNTNLSAKIDDLMNSEGVTEYDQALLQRNKEKVLSYNTEFLKAMKDDPYLALTDHVKYMRNRTTKLSMSLKTSQAIIDIIDGIDKIPDLALSGLISVGSIVGTLITSALSTAVDAITLIDNIDKLNFIAEQFVSVRSKFATDVPSSVDSLFDKPAMIGFSGYPDFSNLLYLPIQGSSGLLDLYKDQINVWATEGYQPSTGANKIVVEEWDPQLLFGEFGDSYYLPSTDVQPKDALPVLINAGSTIKVKPMVYNFDPKYPQRGAVHVLFNQQVNNLISDLYGEERTDHMNISPYLPINGDIVGIYSGFIITMGLLAGGAAAAAAGMKGDFLGMITGAIAATATVTAANGVELQNIINTRTYLGQGKSIYEKLHDSRDSYISKLTNKLVQADGSLDTALLSNLGYVLVSSTSNENIIVNASQLKQTSIYIKEILAFVGNLVGILGASVMIGKVSAKIGRAVKNRKVYKQQKKQFKNERKQLDDTNKKYNEDVDAEIEKVKNDPDLSDEMKERYITAKNAVRDDVNKAYKGERLMIPKTKQEIWTYISNNTGFSNDISVSSAASDIINNTESIGDKFTNAIKSEYEDAKTYFTNNGMSDTNGSNDTKLGEILAAITPLVDKVEGVSSDIRIIKKYT